MFFLLLLISFDILEASRVLIRPKNETLDNGNWTTCEEFVEGTTLDVSSLMNTDWRVFYMWNIQYEDPYTVRFQVASQGLANRFKVEVEKNGKSDIKWNDTAFFMESTMDLSAIFIKTETPGKFRVITSLIFQYDVDPQVIFAVKVVEPGYLGFMNCKIKVCIAFAPIQKMPKDTEIEKAAQFLKVRHPFGYPHNIQDKMLNIPDDVDINDDIEDDVERDIETNSKSMF